MNAIVPASGCPSTFSKALESKVECNSVQVMCIVPRRLKPRFEVFHGFRVIDADQESEIAQPAFQYGTIVLKQLVGDGQSGRCYVNAESIAIAENPQETR